MNNRYNVCLIGRGNVATYLKQALSSSLSVTCSNPHELEKLPAADVYLICVSDNAIAEVASAMNVSNDAVVAHTSGSTFMDVLERFHDSGVVYPLQTFTKGFPVNLRETPIFLETTSARAYKYLAGIAASLSDRVYQIDSLQRRKLHLAAVVAANLSNHLWALASEITEEIGFDFKMLRPLLQTTLDKADALSPYAAQTGPARRHDYLTIENHIEELKSKPVLAKIYREISESIMSTYQ